MSRIWWYANKDGDGWRAHAHDMGVDLQLIQRMFVVDKGKEKVSEKFWTIAFALDDDEWFPTGRKFSSMMYAKTWTESKECQKDAKDWLKSVDRQNKERMKMSELNWKPAPNSALGRDVEVALVSNVVSLVIAPTGDPELKWGLYKVIQGNAHLLLKTFFEKYRAKDWAETGECKSQCLQWPAIEKSKAPKLVPEQRIVAGYRVYFRDGSSIFCVGSLKAIKAQLGPDWSSILPVLVYQYGELENLGQIIDRKA